MHSDWLKLVMLLETSNQSVLFQNCVFTLRQNLFLTLTPVCRDKKFSQNNLIFGSSLSDEFVPDFDFGFQQIPIEVVAVEVQQFANNFTFLRFEK